MFRFVAVWTLLAACVGAQPIGAPPSWRTGGAAESAAAAVPSARAQGPVTFAPAGEAAIRYNEPRQAPPRTPLGDAVIAAIDRAAAQSRLAPPEPDARLFRACADLAEIASMDGVVNYALIEFALQRHGIIEPTPRLLVLWNSIDATESIVAQMRPRFVEMLGAGPAARFGVGAARRNADGTGAIVFALQESGVSTQPIPRSVAAGGTIAIDGVLDPRYRDPEVIVTREDGQTQQIELKPGRAGGFTSQVPCDERRGRQQIEIGASDAAGPTVLANFPVWCAARPPASITVAAARDEAPPATEQAAERDLFAKLNRDRVAAGLAALAWEDRLAQVARAHSQEMRRTHVVAHVSPSTGSVADRVRAARIKTPLVLENLARAYGVGEAHDALMKSPGHRANLMSRAATHGGIGIVFGDEDAGRHEMFVTQLFMRVQPTLDPAAATAAVRKKLATERAVVFAPVLQGLAQTFASELAAGRSRDQAYAQIKEPVNRLGKTYQRVGQVIAVVGDLDAIDTATLLGGTTGNELGLGIAQGPHGELGDNAIWIVVLAAEPRGR